MEQRDLFKKNRDQLVKPAPIFGGPDINAADSVRLSNQLANVVTIMADGEWRTLAELQRQLAYRNTPADLPGVSARLRDLRKTKFGGHTVNRRRIGVGLFSYQLLIRKPNE